MSDKFTYFWREPDCFSQWHPRGFEVDGIYFKTAEHYMMYHKAKVFNDTKHMQEAIDAPHAKDAKDVGRAVNGFIKPVWDQYARNVVYKGNYHKFTQNPDLKEKLLATVGTKLVEASPSDKIWGIGMKEREARERGEENWRGTNWLGEVLDQVREDIIADSYDENRFLLKLEDHD